MATTGDPKVNVRRAPLGGTAVVWPKGVEARYGFCAWTRRNWERSGRLPPRDVNLGGKTGWRPETLERAEQPLERSVLAAC